MRRNYLMRICNDREELGPQDDTLSDHCFDKSIGGGIKRGQHLDRQMFRQTVQLFYKMMDWEEQCVPRLANLYEYELEWEQI